MRPALPEYPVDRYMVQSNINNDLDNIINEDLWESEPALRPEDEKTLRKLHEMLRSTADDLKVLSGELAKQREHEIRIKSMPTPVDEDFNEKVHIEEVVSAKFFGHKIADDRNSATPVHNVQKNVVDGLIKTIAEKQKTKHTTTKGVQVNEAPVKKINYKNLVKSQTRVVQVNHEKENTENNRNIKSNKLNKISRIGYSEYSYKYVEPKPLLHIKRNLQVQKLPKVNIRSELKIQNVLQLDILPDDAKKGNSQNFSYNNSSVFIVKHRAELAESNQLDALVNFKPVASQISPVKKSLDRKVSKIQTCESSESTEHVASDISQLSKSQKYFKRIQNKSPIINKAKGKSKSVRNTTTTSLDEWRNKLNAVYGPSSSKTLNSVRLQSKTKNQNPIRKANTDSKGNNKKGLNNVEYIPYTKLTLGGVSLDEIEKEIPDLPDKKEMHLGPILEKILSSRENTISANSPKNSRQNMKNILTTSDENLLKEVLNIQEKVSKSLQDEDDKNNMSNDENDTYADDFDDDKTDSSYHNITHHNDSSKSPDNEGSSKESKTNNSPITDEEKIEFKIQNETYTKSNSLSFKNSVDVFEYVHEIDTQDSGTQINLNRKMTRKQTQTSPRTDKNNIQSIHNDLKSNDPLEEVENMFKLEKDFIKKLILEEYGDIFTKSISKPSISGHESGIINENSTQKDTQTSPARMKSVMTSPTRTKTRTTSPFAVSKIDRHTSPIPANSNEEQQPVCDDISIILSSPRFSLRLPQTSRDVMSNLDTKPQRKPKIPVQSRKNLTSSSSSSVDEYSSSDISSWGQIERYRQNRKLRLSTTEDSSSSPTPRRSELSQMPTKSEGEISLGQIRRKVRSKDRSEGEASIGELLRRARK